MSPVASKGTETSGSTEASTMTQASVVILLGLGLGHCDGGDEYGEDTHPDTHTAAGRLGRGQHGAQWRLLRSQHLKTHFIWMLKLLWDTNVLTAVLTMC